MRMTINQLTVAVERDLLPPLSTATSLKADRSRLFVGAPGFELRSLGWVRSQRDRCVQRAVLMQYIHPKGRNKRKELLERLRTLGVARPVVVQYNVPAPQDFEDRFRRSVLQAVRDVDEVVIDITGMTKYAILVALCVLSDFAGSVRLVYSEAAVYPPSRDQYEIALNEGIARAPTFPSQGVEGILRARCMSSIRMQGQPVVLVAFASFNEQLIRYMLGSLTPHLLLLINGRPPRHELRWRERATQSIHERVLRDYLVENPVDSRGRLVRVVSTLQYKETVHMLEDIYASYGRFKRIVVAATGSKMQTVGVFVAKMRFPDVHIEYPAPDSFFIRGRATGIRRIHEVVFDRFAEAIHKLRFGSQLTISPDKQL